MSLVVEEANRVELHKKIEVLNQAGHLLEGRKGYLLSKPKLMSLDVLTALNPLCCFMQNLEMQLPTSSINLCTVICQCFLYGILLK